MLIILDITIYSNQISPIFFFLLAIQLGNPDISNPDDWRGWVDYAWSHAVISDETHRNINRLCNFSSDDVWNNDKCNEAIAEVDKQYNEIDIYSLYTSACKGDSAKSSYFASAQFKTNYHISSKRVCVRYKTLYIFFLVSSFTFPHIYKTY